MAGNFAYMQKKGGKIEKVPLAKWAGYRRKGYEFSDENDYNEQQSKGAAKAEEAPAKKKKVSKKKS